MQPDNVSRAETDSQFPGIPAEYLACFAGSGQGARAVAADCELVPEGSTGIGVRADRWVKEALLFLDVVG